MSVPVPSSSLSSSSKNNNTHNSGDLFVYGKRNRKQQEATHHYGDNTDDHDKMNTHCQSTVVISASKVSSLSGFNPYADLPKDLLSLVYQGKIGRKNLERDLKLLGIHMISDEEFLMELSKKAGEKVFQSVSATVDISRGRKKVNSIDQANVIKNQTLKLAKASGKLSKTEIAALKDGVSHNVNTGFGTSHEEDALDLYENECGWEVRERNAEVRCLSFAKAEDVIEYPGQRAYSEKGCDNQGYYSDDDGFDAKSVIQLGSAFTFSKLNSTKNNKKLKQTNKLETCGKSIDNAISLDSDDDRINENKTDEVVRSCKKRNEKRRPCQQMTINVNSPKQNSLTKSNLRNDQCEKVSKTESNRLKTPSLHNNASLPSHEKENDYNISSISCDEDSKFIKPYFNILGVVDGVRDELYQELPSQNDSLKSDKNNKSNTIPNNTDHKKNDFLEHHEDNWCLRQVVVECKHRMYRPFVPPPIYDQIQAIVYCHMYSTDEAEIVQVVRNNRTNESSLKRGQSMTHTNSLHSEVVSSIHKEVKCSNHKNNNNDSSKRLTCKNTKSEKYNDKQTKLTCSRVSLNDSISQHRNNWHTTILPRLRSFVDAVYSFRCDDHKRYKMLSAAAAASSGGNISDSWDVLFRECPWLLHCDTAYTRKGGKKLIYEKN